MGESDVNDVDEEERRKENDSLVVIIRMWEEVRVAREGIGTSKKLAWDMDHFKIEVCKVDEPSGLLAVESLWGMEVGEVLVIREDLDREL